jgi:hypothetical protein
MTDGNCRLDIFCVSHSTQIRGSIVLSIARGLTDVLDLLSFALGLGDRGGATGLLGPVVS